MTALFFLAVYGAAGLGAAVWVLARKRAGLGQALLTLVLWPFLLPVSLSPGAPVGPRPEAARSERGQRLDDVVERLEACWRQAAVECSWAAEQAREHRLLDAFVLRLRAQERRLGEMEVALASAPASVKERLTRMYEHAVGELEHSIGLVEELVAQLTLLRFAGLGSPAASRVERGHIEELLLRIEALTDASQSGSGDAPMARA
jgi:hypothetical protein